MEEPSTEEEEVEEEPPTEEEDATYWDPVYDKWRNVNQLWLMTYGGGPAGGYIIDYASTPRAVPTGTKGLVF